PSVVDVDVDIAGIFHAAGDHGVSLGAHGSRIDLLREMIPAVPAHRRSRRKLAVLRGSRENGHENDGALKCDSLQLSFHVLSSPFLLSPTPIELGPRLRDCYCCRSKLAG